MHELLPSVSCICACKFCHVTVMRRKIRLIESNAKCRYLNLPVKGLFAAGVYLSGGPFLLGFCLGWCTAPATSSYPSLKNSFNGCQGHPPHCLPPRTAQRLPDRIPTMFGRAVFIQLTVVGDINAKTVEA